MNRIALPLAVVLISSSSFAQSAPIVVVKPAQVLRLSTPSGPVIVRTIEPQNDKQPELGVWIGVELKPRKDGAEWLEVTKVIPGSPAEGAGVQAGDKLVSLAGRQVSDHAELLEVLRTRHPGERLQLTVERSAKIKLSESPEDDHHALLGVNTADQADAKPSERGGRNGLPITSLVPGMAAESSGLVAGERICAVGGKEIGSFKQLQTEILSHDAGDEVEVRTQRDVNVELAPRPGQAQSGHSVAGMGGHAFGNGNALVPAQPGLGGGKGLFSPEPNQGETWPSTPGQPPPGALVPKQPPHARLAIPVPPSEDGRPKARSMTPGNGDDGIRVQLLDEIRALRKEVAELRRQIDAMRDQKSKNAR
jgi:membrane-associated protease RseP (regulator of RpoE activity)